MEKFNKLAKLIRDRFVERGLDVHSSHSEVRFNKDESRFEMYTSPDGEHKIFSIIKEGAKFSLHSHYDYKVEIVHEGTDKEWITIEDDLHRDINLHYIDKPKPKLCRDCSNSSVDLERDCGYCYEHCAHWNPSDKEEDEHICDCYEGLNEED